MDPKGPITHFVLGSVYEKEGQYDLAIQEYRKFAQLAGTDPETSPWTSSAYALAGKHQNAPEILERRNATPKNSRFSALGEAVLFVGLGDKERAFAWLEKAYEAHEWFLIELKADPRFDSLRTDPRFQDLVRRIGL